LRLVAEDTGDRVVLRVAAAGTYQWVAIYSGDSKNNPVASVFGDEPETATAGISGVVFCDNNLNGVLDSSGSGDTPESGAVVTLKLGSTVVATKATDSGGAYSFTGLTAGTYTVTLTTPSA